VRDAYVAELGRLSGVENSTTREIGWEMSQGAWRLELRRRLTLRLSPRTRFILEFMARVRGQTITTVIERALQEAAEDVMDEKGNQYRWQDYWDIRESVRALRIINSDLFPTPEEEQLAAFTNEFWPFFYTAKNKSVIVTDNADTLWPRIEEYMAIWGKTSNDSSSAAAKAMEDTLRAAGLPAPNWRAPKRSGGHRKQRGYIDRQWR